MHCRLHQFHSAYGYDTRPIAAETDDSFSIEASILCVFVLLSLFCTSRPKESTSRTVAPSLSVERFTRYFLIVLFYNAILWMDWSIVRWMLKSDIYSDWANTRILFERILLPLLNVAQVAAVGIYYAWL